MESDSWDFYFIELDGDPASISVDFKYESIDERRTHDTAAIFEIQMHDVGEHGWGSRVEAEALWPLEKEIAAAASNRFVWVARMRTAGLWTLFYYGGPDVLEVLRPIAHGLDRGERSAQFLHKSDPRWQFYEEELLPNPERRGWISDRKVVHSLEQQGDDLDAERPVDHFAYFRTAAGRDAFVAEAAKAGFRLERISDDAVSDDGDREFRFAAQVVRDDSVELERIHEVVWTLVLLANEHDGVYDGWGAPIVKPKSGWLRRRG